MGLPLIYLGQGPCVLEVLQRTGNPMDTSGRPSSRDSWVDRNHELLPENNARAAKNPGGLV